MKGFSCVALLLFASIALVAQQAAPAPQSASPGFAGIWEVDDQPAWNIVLEAAGAKVTGKVVQGNQEAPILETTIAGDQISFTVKSPDGDRTITFVGTRKGDAISFKRTVVIREGGNPGGPALMGGNSGPAEFITRRATGARWLGTVRNAPTPRNPDPPPNPRPAGIATRKIPDPHWRWRGGEKELTVRMFTLANQTYPVNGFELAGDRLTYSFSRPGPGDEVTCSLQRQPDGQFRGRCQADTGNFVQLIELTPPEGQGSGKEPGR